MTPTPIMTLTTERERAQLEKLAREVPEGGLILEIGTLYGGITSLIALAAPQATVYSVDNFSWSPEGYPENSPQLVVQNMDKVGVNNAVLMAGDSRVLCKTWDKHIDFLWIDGGHSFEYVYSDLYNFSKFADVIALHDYGNESWPTIQKAVEIFLDANPEWEQDSVVDLVCTLRRAEHAIK